MTTDLVNPKRASRSLCSGVTKAYAPAHPVVTRVCILYLVINYIPSYLHADTQVALHVKMENARSQSDVQGSIYTFETRDPDDSKTTQLEI